MLIETKLAQDIVQEKLGLTAVDKEVVLIYENESAPPEAQVAYKIKYFYPVSSISLFLQNKFVVEVPRPRPQWFSRNLLQRSTDSSTTTAISTEAEPVSIAVKPSDLG